MNAVDLSDLDNVTVSLRLVLDASGQLVNGSAIDPNGESIGRFRTMGEAASLVIKWLAAAAPREDQDGEDTAAEGSS